MAVIKDNYRCYPFKLAPMPFDVRTLYPYLDPTQVKYHYYTLYGGYVRRLNELVKDNEELYALKDKTLRQILEAPWEIDGKYRSQVLHLAGGISNHELFFSALRRQSDTMPPPKARSCLSESFGSFDGFKSVLLQAAQSVYGSGWVWLIKTGEGKAAVAVSANHESPYTHGTTPILCLDMWEHAYYCTFKSDRERYIRALLALCDWRVVEARLTGG